MNIEEILKLPLLELVEYLDKNHRLSQNRLAERVKNEFGVACSSSAITQIKNGTYTGNESIEKNVREWVKRFLEEQMKPTIETKKIDFPYVQAARERIKVALEMGYIVLLRGNSGTGKTTLLNEFAQQKGYIKIQAHKRMKASELQKLIATAVSDESRYPNMNSIMQKIKGKTLIIDEANKLSEGILEWLRSLHDKAKIPMLWGGTYEDISAILERQPELDRRTKKAHLVDIEKNELKELVASFGFKMVEEFTNELFGAFGGRLGKSASVLKDMKYCVENKGFSEDLNSLEAMIEMME